MPHIGLRYTLPDEQETVWRIIQMVINEIPNAGRPNTKMQKDRGCDMLENEAKKIRSKNIVQKRLMQTLAYYHEAHQTTLKEAPLPGPKKKKHLKNQE